MSDEKAPTVPQPDVPPPVPGVEIFDAAETPAVAAPWPAAPASPAVAHPALRALAFAMDGIGTVVATAIVVFGGLGVSYGWAFYGTLFVPVLSAVLSTVLTAVYGVTPSKAILGIRVVDVVTGRPIGWRSILRSLVIVSPLALAFALSWALAYSPVDLWAGYASYLPPVGWIALLVVLCVRPHHRGLQDLAGRSVVVRR